MTIQPASIFLLALLALFLFVDFATLKKRGRRVVAIEAIAFLAGGLVIAFPESTQVMAKAVGIGRGVDLVIYVVVVWLVRESIMMRHARIVESEKFTQLVRSVAIEGAQRRAAVTAAPST